MSEHERRPTAVDPERRAAALRALTNLLDVLDATRRRLDDEVRRRTDRRLATPGDGSDDDPARSARADRGGPGA